MQHARKMVLVPHDVAQQLHASHQHSLAPTYQGLDGLDEQMQGILRRRDIPVDERVKLYQQALLSYVNMHQKLNQPMAVKVETTPYPSATETTRLAAGGTDAAGAQSSATSWVQKVAESVPKTFRKKAEQLVTLVEEAPSRVLRFNEAGELVVGGQRIEGTHVIDLINDMLRKRKSFNPHGWQKFAHALATLRPPQELIGNEDRWRFMQREGREHSTASRGRISLDESRDMYARASHLPSPEKKRRAKPETSPVWFPY